ncbi:hypothetical protein GCM10010372_84610 [Streptomyces tauricus]|nr:hypothetical protein GCM10010372_84610 [Streptomyces tauricus]
MAALAPVTVLESAAEASPISFGAAATGGAAAVTGNAAKADGLITLSGQVDVGSNATVIGVGSSSGFTGDGLRLKNVSNVVVRNLSISKPLALSDGVTVHASTKVWIDHNSSPADWDHDKDHFKGSFAGHSDSNASEDTGHLKVTYDHNRFSNVYSRIPSVRFGTGPFYDDHVVGADTAVRSPQRAHRRSSRTASSARPRSRS